MQATLTLTELVHELKTPITSIIGYVELLKNGSQTEEEKKDYYNIIDCESNRLLNMINEFLKEKKKKIDKEIQKCDIIAQIKRCINELRPQAETKKIKFYFNSNKKLIVAANENRVLQVLLNIIENAVKYNIEGGKIRISTEISDDKAIVVVSDTGIGFPEKDKEKIFKKNYRSEETRKLNIPGTGLGLAISKKIVESYGGRLSVDNINHTEFKIELPIKK